MLYTVIVNDGLDASVSLWSNEARAQLEKKYAEENWGYTAQLWETDEIHGVEQADDIDHLLSIIERITEEDEDGLYEDTDWNEVIDGDERVAEAVKLYI